MKILRDERGEVVILPAPSFGTRGEAVVREKSFGWFKKPAPAAPIPIAVRATAHCCFFCKWCDTQILLPHERLGMAFGNPVTRKIDVRSIATVCPSCNHVAPYSLFRGCNGFDTRHKVMDVPASGKTIFIDWLHCEEETCPFQVPFFLKLDGDISEAGGRLMSAGWLWKEVACASGHRIQSADLAFGGLIPPKTF